MPKTVLLKPLDNSCFDEENKKQIKENAEKIKQVLDNMEYGEDVCFENFLNKLQLTEESYTLAISVTRYF